MINFNKTLNEVSGAHAGISFIAAEYSERYFTMRKHSGRDQMI